MKWWENEMIVAVKSLDEMTVGKMTKQNDNRQNDCRQNDCTECRQNDSRQNDCHDWRQNDCRQNDSLKWLDKMAEDYKWNASSSEVLGWNDCWQNDCG